MPPRTRTRTTKVMKENIENVKKSKPKSDTKASKAPRKALADKTNSLSDDNASIDVPIKPVKSALKVNVLKTNADDKVRPKRERRLPTRYVENNMLKNLSNSNDSPNKQSPQSTKLKPLIEKSTAQSVDKLTDILVEKTKDKPQVSKSVEISSKSVKPTKNVLSSNNDVMPRPKRNCRIQSVKETVTSNENSLNITSPFKTPTKDADSSLIMNRPKRICRLPSRFEDHSISPSKFIPVQPCHASTPILQKTVQNSAKNSNKDSKSNPKAEVAKRTLTRKVRAIKINQKSNSSDSSVNKSSPDSNNNGNNKARPKRVIAKKLQTKISPQANKITKYTKLILNKSASFRVLEDKKKPEDKKGLDVYEFTFDPNEEPAPKKKKRIVRKRQPKPKTVAIPKTVTKSNYNEKVSKAIAGLKDKVKPSQTPQVTQSKPTTNNTQNTQNIPKPITENVPQDIIKPASVAPANDTTKNSVHESNYASIRIEDIAADFEESDHHNDVNYSPVTSPCRPKTPEVRQNEKQVVNNTDPLNLQDVSFFDELPVASSSMNTSVRHPLASPWRVEFNNLPIRWQANTYVKPNMTPAVECSFINSEESTKKKHVYTNMLPAFEPPQETTNLKQTSIIHFMKEVAERSLNKKKRKRSVSPTKANFIFDDMTNNDFGQKTPKKAKKDNTPNSKENSNSSNKSASPVKAKNNKDHTLFGFDDSENQDRENVSPIKIQNTRYSKRRRAVLGEVNAQNGPMRAVMPVSAKLTSSEVVNQLFNQMKSAEDAPEIPEKESPNPKNCMTNVDQSCIDDEDSVHLFEDIEIVHHLKPHRKSYTKAKKVAFQDSDSDSESPHVQEQNNSSDDLADLSFHLPNIKEKKTKKKKPKKLLSKKEEKEVEAWAAGFNSMCEDIDEFPLVVE